MHLYVATTNPGKLRDFALATEEHRLADAANPANGSSIRIEPLPALATLPAPPEDGPTFEANARLKAIYYSLHAPGQLVLADDSGLEVAALDGAPGVRSARYADDVAALAPSPNATAATPESRNNAVLLRALASIPEARRQAHYRCSLALARDGQVLTTAEGTVDGRILTAPRGSGGFGYDPLFFLPALNCTMSELPPADRLALNHRGRALRALLSQSPLLQRLSANED
jgi:XTP/dITP diphosphohydrolase